MPCPAGRRARLCDAGAIPVIWDRTDGCSMLAASWAFSRTQRIASRPATAVRFLAIVQRADLAVRIPPHRRLVGSPWRTDVDDGVPLCGNCHLRLHNQRWRITRQRDPVGSADTYWLHPPPDPVTAEIGDPVRLRSKSPRRFGAA